MEKDLRDAYAALKLLRADLVKTRRDKRALEASLTQLQTLQTPRQTHERQQMQHEDTSAQLLRLTTIYESRLAEMETQLLHNNCQKKETPEIEDNQHEEEETEGLEKLALLNKLHSLTATLEQQTQTMLAQQAAFALQKGELETILEDTHHKLQTEERKVADAVQEQQVAKENYEFLETQVEILKEEKKKLEQEKTNMEIKLAAHAQTSSILKQQLEEKEEEKRKWESEQEKGELMLQLEYEQKMEELGGKFRRENEMKEMELRQDQQREIGDLERKCGLLELELIREKEGKPHDQEEIQERFAVTLHDLENSCAELESQLEGSEAKRYSEAKEHKAKLVEAEEQYATTLHYLETELEEAREQLATSETEMKEQETKLEIALNELRDQQDVRENYSEKLCSLENSLAEVQSILVVSEVKVADESKKHQKELAEALQKLHDQELAQENNTIAMRAMENNLAEVKMQLADAEDKRFSEVEKYEEKLTQVLDLAAQHEKTARALRMEKKTLEQEVHEARQTSKITTEEFLKCQSVMEQKTKEHLQYLNQVQEQCESLETQLLATEDHNVSRAVKPVHDSYTLKAYHGLSDDEIIALPSSKSWALLRAGISELNDFLPQLQILLGAISDVLTLCESHADTLPTLCERLQGKVASDMAQLPILPVSVRLVRFAVALKTRIQQEAPVTVKIVQDVRRNVLDALTQWYECDADDNDHGGSGMTPTPTFTITSRETALILQNWTNDRTKQLGVRRWLARMEAYPGVPPLRGASSNRVLELPPEGCTLELEDMTPEVKDAFLLLLIPILKQNRALHVRVFTRYRGDRCITSKQQAPNNNDEDNPEAAEKVWSMRIHVQSAITKRTRSFGRPAPLQLTPSPRDPPSPLAPTSPASSVASSTSSTASSRLQIIQERLHYLHNNG